ncbi:MAG: hypothetical protein JST54_06090 [Deltaproteobacteria bacterium]|nr:hypothetical protein [Deltaproteobacteria bacterium]
MLIDCKGKQVRGSDGHKIGKVVRCDSDELVVESGLFKVRDFTVGMDEVASVSGSEVFLRRPAEQYRADAPRSPNWTPWHSGRASAEAREELDALARADREHRLGAQANPGLAAQARTSMAASADRLPSEMDDRLGAVEGIRDPFTPDEPRGSPPEARMPPMAHPEKDPWP